MEIDAQPSNIQTSKSQVNNYSQQQSNNETENAKITTDNSVKLSATAQARSSSSVINQTEITEIASADEAQEVVNQLAQTAANDPVLAKEAQSSHITSDLVKRLIG